MDGVEERRGVGECYLELHDITLGPFFGWFLMKLR